MEGWILTKYYFLQITLRNHSATYKDYIRFGKINLIFSLETALIDSVSGQTIKFVILISLFRRRKLFYIIIVVLAVYTWIKHPGKQFMTSACGILIFGTEFWLKGTTKRPFTNMNIFHTVIITFPWLANKFV